MKPVYCSVALAFDTLLFIVVALSQWMFFVACSALVGLRHFSVL